MGAKQAEGREVMLTQEDTPLRTVTAGKTLTVFLDGDIDHHTARLIRSRIDTKVYIQRPDELILDLSRVCFMDSSGLGLILGRYAKAVELGIAFKVANPSPQIRRILDLAGTERLIKIESAHPSRRAW
jgi:stage II sporulation protein AA (anti-sigma F factor antagonist)